MKTIADITSSISNERERENPENGLMLKKFLAIDV